MKIVCISDTHCNHSRMKYPITSWHHLMPEVDLMLVAGDFTSTGRIDQVIGFNKWLGKIKAAYPHLTIITIAGNHDWIFHTMPELGKLELTNTIYLQDELYEYKGLKIWGTPWQPEFCNWAFNVDRGELHKYWDMIPTDVDILVTHGPPYGIQDQCMDGHRPGCEEMLETYGRINPKLHVFGHIHYAYGQTKYKNTIMVNASICGEDYEPVNRPIVVEI